MPAASIASRRWAGSGPERAQQLGAPPSPRPAPRSAAGRRPGSPAPGSSRRSAAAPRRPRLRDRLVQRLAVGAAAVQRQAPRAVLGDHRGGVVGARRCRSPPPRRRPARERSGSEWRSRCASSQLIIRIVVLTAARGRRPGSARAVRPSRTGGVAAPGLAPARARRAGSSSTRGDRRGRWRPGRAASNSSAASPAVSGRQVASDTATGQPRCHRLQHHEAEALVQAGVHQQVGAAQQRVQPGVATRSRPAPPAVRRRRGAPLALAGVQPGQHQPVVQALVAQPRVGLDEPPEVLLRAQVAHGQQVGPGRRLLVTRRAGRRPAGSPAPGRGPRPSGAPGRRE